jgi:branched-chain amino acid transport system permease protein
MNVTGTELSATVKGLKNKIIEIFSLVPVIGWLFSILIAVILEQIAGTSLAWTLGLPKIPALFGFLIMLKKPLLIPSTILYVMLIYIIPIGVIARLSLGPANSLAKRLCTFSIPMSVLVHLVLLYAIFHIWTGISNYRLITLKFTLIAIMVTVSLNVINGYMGEFSCSHTGFMALGAYTASTFSLLLFVNDNMFGQALVPSFLGPFLFPFGLMLGGCVAAVGALIVAIPSFRTRGDYLAIISLAFMFIVKSLIENLEVLGGPRGLSSQPDWANLPTVFIWTIICIWVINNFVRSILGKALNAIRDEETAANAMTVDTKRTKVIAYMFSAFWAGVAGGLFAHVLGYVNPATFGIQRLAEVLAMVYFGGLNSVYGSIVGAVSLSLLGEALRPLELFKWIAIPLLLIIVMIYRPTGLIAFRELNVNTLIRPKRKSEKEE